MIFITCSAKLQLSTFHLKLITLLEKKQICGLTVHIIQCSSFLVKNQGSGRWITCSRSYNCCRAEPKFLCIQSYLPLYLLCISYGLLKWKLRSAWVAQLVKHPTLDFGSGHDLRVLRLSPVSGSALNGEPGWDSLSPYAPPCFLSLKKKKKKLMKWKMNTHSNRFIPT